MWQKVLSAWPGSTRPYHSFNFREWANGRVWELSRESEFPHLSLQEFQVRCYRWARDHRQTCRTKTDKAAQTITVQYFDKVGAE